MTLKDVAARAGVAVSTVSRALNSSGYVDPETRDRVLEAAQELSYRPNVLARGLRSRQTGVIGFIVPDLRSQFYAESSSVLQGTVNQAGRQLLVGVSHDDPEAEMRCLERFEEQQVDGVVVIPTGLEARCRRRFRFPMVELNRVSDGTDNDTVVADEQEGLAQLTKLMLDAGHRRVAFVVGGEETSTARSRTAGFLAAMESAGADVSGAVFAGTYTPHWGSEAAQRVLDGGFTAAVVASSHVMEGFAEACKAQGARIPEQLSIGSMGDPAWFRFWSPSVTTYSPDLATMGRLAAERILARLASDAPRGETVHEVVPGRIVVRESIAPPA